MNDFGVLLTTYGVTSVFILLFLIIITTEVLKKAFKSRPSKSALNYPLETELNIEETAAVTAAIMAYNIDNALIETSTKFSYNIEPKTWRDVSKIELMNRRLK